MTLFTKKFARPLLLSLIAMIVIVEIVILSPSPLEQMRSASNLIHPDALIPKTEASLIKDLPQGKIPEYSVDRFQYTSIQNGQKQWKLESDQAYFYHSENLVHSRGVKTFLFDQAGKVTRVEGKESKFNLKQKDLEIFGSVKTVFPDGFELYSDYLKYQPREHRIFIPQSEFAHGKSNQSSGQKFEFTSQGLDYAMEKAMIILSKDVTFTLHRLAPHPERTQIISDICTIDRATNLAQFTMNRTSPLQTRFVRITQPDLLVKSRRAELNYGDFHQIVQFLISYEDVVIQELSSVENLQKAGAPPLRYGTAGKAEFNAHSDTITLTEFPQVYQNGDTVTGEKILLHRDSDIIEVEQSNSFSNGSEA